MSERPTFTSHRLAEMLLAMNDREVYCHEPEFDVFHRVVKLIVEGDRIYLVPAYDHTGVALSGRRS